MFSKLNLSVITGCCFRQWKEELNVFDGIWPAKWVKRWKQGRKNAQSRVNAKNKLKRVSLGDAERMGNVNIIFSPMHVFRKKVARIRTVWRSRWQNMMIPGYVVLCADVFIILFEGHYRRTIVRSVMQKWRDILKPNFRSTKATDKLYNRNRKTDQQMKVEISGCSFKTINNFRIENENNWSFIVLCRTVTFTVIY